MGASFFMATATNSVMLQAHRIDARFKKSLTKASIFSVVFAIGKMNLLF